MKRLTVCLIIMLLLLLITLSVQAEENTYKGDFTGLIGNKSVFQSSYQLTDNLSLNGDLEELDSNLENSKYSRDKDYFLRTDLHYQITNWLGIKIGGRYDSASGESIPYGGFDLSSPFFSSNLKVFGHYDYNYQGKDWVSYEFAWRIQMYQHFWLDAGVRGDGGKGFIRYDYNQANDPLFFIRGDFNQQWGKYSLDLQPLLYATGYILTNNTLEYHLNDRTGIVLNINDLYDRELKYRVGLQYKF